MAIAGRREIFLIQVKLASPSRHFPYHTLSCGTCPALAAVYSGAPAAAALALPGPYAAAHRARGTAAGGCRWGPGSALPSGHPPDTFSSTLCERPVFRLASIRASATCGHVT